jgi:16S rRNA (guanine966-N2)-methyltransferase
VGLDQRFPNPFFKRSPRSLGLAKTSSRKLLLSQLTNGRRRLGKNRVRITGGQLRSRLITFPARADLRPTPDRVRETLFNWLGQDLTGKSCLDLFAGSGALGFEAASRGAAPVVLVDRDREVCAALDRSARTLAANGVSVVCAEALTFLARGPRKFDVIFIDPPYASDALQRCLPHLPAHLTEDGVLYVESNSRTALGEDWRVLREAKAGQVRFLLAGRAKSGGIISV